MKKLLAGFDIWRGEDGQYILVKNGRAISHHAHRKQAVAAAHDCGETSKLGRPPEIPDATQYCIRLSPAQVATAQRLGDTVSAGVRAALDMAEKPTRNRQGANKAQ